MFLMKAFGMLVLRKRFASMYSSHLFFRIDVNTLPTQEVRTIGRKFPGSSGLLKAAYLGIGQTIPCFQEVGTVADTQQEL